MSVQLLFPTSIETAATIADDKQSVSFEPQLLRSRGVGLLGFLRSADPVSGKVLTYTLSVNTGTGAVTLSQQADV